MNASKFSFQVTAWYAVLGRCFPGKTALGGRLARPAVPGPDPVAAPVAVDVVVVDEAVGDEEGERVTGALLFLLLVFAAIAAEEVVAVEGEELGLSSRGLDAGLKELKSMEEDAP